MQQWLTQFNAAFYEVWVNWICVIKNQNLKA